MATEAHKSRHVSKVRCALVTVSDTRTPQSDESGQVMREAIEAAGHVVVSYEIIPDEPAMVSRRVVELANGTDCRAMMLSGGTGIAPRDTTYEAIVPLLGKGLDGFGELFRMLSFQEIGPAAMLSRAMAGVIGDKIVFVMPGSPAAVGLAMKKLILPVLGHAVHLLGGGSRSSRHGGSATSSRG